MNAVGLVLLGSVLGLASGCVFTWATYRNGVTDGFGFAWEPTNPGYRKAGRYLREHMTYRWRQLGNSEYTRDAAK